MVVLRRVTDANGSSRCSSRASSPYTEQGNINHLMAATCLLQEVVVCSSLLRSFPAFGEDQVDELSSRYFVGSAAPSAIARADDRAR
jgi:hypothetical protein